ncbi:hypothetical protein Bca4012_070893 [Brassica carinata]
MENPYITKTRPLIKRAKARSLMATWLFVIGERNSGVTRHRVVSSFFFFFLFSFSPLRRRNGDFYSFRWLYSINGVSLGGSCRRRKTASPLTVALVDQGKRRDVSHGGTIQAKPFYLSDKTPMIVCKIFVAVAVQFYFFAFLSLFLRMDSYPSASSSKFVELLNSQQTVSFGNYEDSVELSSSQLSFQGSFGTEASNFDGDTATESKKRKCEDGGDSSASQATENKHPPSVKATKASSKKKVVEENSLNGFQSMWTIKQHDLLIKEQLSKMSLLDSLLGKKELLAEYEEALKAKLINDLMSS